MRTHLAALTTKLVDAVYRAGVTLTFAVIFVFA